MAPLLIIDNDSSSRTLLAKQLETYSYDVHVAATPEEAILKLNEAYERGAPFGAICLASMIGCTEVGHQLAQRIRAMRGYRATPIIAGSFVESFWEKVAHHHNFNMVQLRFAEGTADSVWDIRRILDILPFPLTRAA